MARWIVWISLVGACSASDEPERARRKPAGTEASVAPTASEPDAPEEDDDPLGTEWEDDRRQAMAGCEQATESTFTGDVLEQVTFDDQGWPVQRRTLSDGEVVAEVVTTYVRGDDDRLVSSETVREVEVELPAPVAKGGRTNGGTGGGADTGLDGGSDSGTAGTSDSGGTAETCVGTETVAVTYDAAQRPAQTVTTVSGCGPTTEVLTTHDHLVEGGRLYHSASYVDDKLVRYVTYDRCTMVKRDDGLRYRGTYGDDCEVLQVEVRKYGWNWYWEGGRPVRFDIDNTESDYVYTYTGCLR